MPRVVDDNQILGAGQARTILFDVPADNVIVLYGLEPSPADLIDPSHEVEVTIETLKTPGGWQHGNSFVWKGDLGNTVNPQVEYDHRLHAVAGDKGRVTMSTTGQITARLTVDFGTTRVLEPV